MAEPMSDARLERLAGLAELPCTCGTPDCERYTSALTATEAQELVAEARRARAELAKHPSQWEVRRSYPNGNTIVLVGMDETQARAELAQNGGTLYERCGAGQWRKVETVCCWCTRMSPSSSDCICIGHCGTHACASGGGEVDRG